MRKEIESLIESLGYDLKEHNEASEVVDEIVKITKQSFLQGAKKQREADIEACDESMNQWHNETAEFLKYRKLLADEDVIWGNKNG